MEEQMRLYIRLAMEDSGFHLHTSMDNNMYNLINVTRFPSFDTSARMRFGVEGKILGFPNQRNDRLKGFNNMHGSYQHSADQKEKVEKKINSYHIQEEEEKEDDEEEEVEEQEEKAHIVVKGGKDGGVGLLTRERRRTKLQRRVQLGFANSRQRKKGASVGLREQPAMEDGWARVRLGRDSRTGKKEVGLASARRSHRRER
ncbi:hypothetical protein M5K25_009040 [Dendrobium thyrsiflorum]|uniref:Uncharacterized protein n=1 Tax=Dendrobium thyrsiflorum TaxID=117978 RepID=A0ABD0V4J4_DENTH